MNEFANKFRDLCIEKGINLRKISDATGKNIRYLSDIKYGRRVPPSDEVVAVIEKVLGVENRTLRELAKVVRETPKEFSNFMKNQPMVQNLALTLLRAENTLTPEEWNNKMIEVNRIFGTSEDEI